MQIKELHNQLDNNPLLLTRFTNHELEKLAQNCAGKNIFFGAGIMTKDQLSQAVPFDILAFFFTAEQLRRAFSSQKVVIFVADQHAITNNLFPKKQINQTTVKTIELFKKIIVNFSLNNFEIVRTIELNKVQSIRDIFAKLPSIENQYLKHEMADTIWLQKFHHVGIKLGWSMSKSLQVDGHDERFFDQTIKKFCPSINFIHLKPGRTFDKLRPRVSPYISVVGETRILLKKGENIAVKLELTQKNCSPEVFKATQRHLSYIARLHEQLFEPLKFMNFENKLQTILNKAVK